jgi:rhodanese-related sulfurtransferase
MSLTQKTQVVVIVLAVFGGVLPIAAYWACVGRVPAVTPNEARQLLTTEPSTTLLIDVRAPDEYAAGHLEAAQPWSDREIAAGDSAGALPPAFRGKRLLLICNSGLCGAAATHRLRTLGVPDVFNVEGGMQAWVASGERPCTLSLCRLRPAAGKARELPFREAPIWEQYTAVATGFFVKPLYMLLSLVAALVLWWSRGPDLVALRWAMLWFFLGEAFCAANYLVYAEGSLLFEFLHSYGMVLCFGLTIFALLEGIDLRLVRYSDPHARCAALSLCQRCIKHAAVPCGLQRTFLWLIPAVMVLCGMPYCAALLPVSYNTRILGTFYNYSHAVASQMYEIRVLPAVSWGLLAVAWVVLVRKGQDAVWWSKICFSAGSGALGFALFRMILLQTYRDNLLWFATWEEVTELLFILGVGLVLWSFRHGLFFESLPARAVGAAAARPAGAAE